VKVVFTVLARRSLQDIYEQIREFSPVAARRTRANILARARQLAAHPESGRVVPEFDVRSVRELIEGPYRIWYRMRDDRVEVLVVFHGARHVESPPTN
jgi:plasmid stabilization system protein ParE